MIRLDGKAVAEQTKAQLIPQIDQFKTKYGRPPHLVVALIGEDSASQVYVKNKQLACEKIGLKSTVIRKASTLSQAELEKLVLDLNSDDEVDGVLVQMPLPAHLNSDRVFELLSPFKDADGFSYFSTGLLWAGKPLVKPCTPAGIIQILKFYKIALKGKNVVVVGRSHIVGKPVAALLLEENATVTIAHSHTINLKELTQKADIVVVAAGKPELLGKDDFKKEAVIVDVGIHGTGQGNLRGDVRFQELDGWVSAATPVPGGVGPMTIAMLLKNTVLLAEKRKRTLGEA